MFQSPTGGPQQGDKSRLGARVVPTSFHHLLALGPLSLSEFSFSLLQNGASDTTYLIELGGLNGMCFRKHKAWSLALVSAQQTSEVTDIVPLS